ncbi:MAG TPA: GTPase ObgE [Thermoanaerobacterales bacterium]|nr:GTPase ObgE [Thermoanaerobacterales bacterium]
MFLDEVKIHIKAGKGGNGAVAFRREKNVPFGGPSGGDGGHGGDIVFEADNNFNTLLDFKYQRHHRAKPGQNGSGSNRMGRDASDLVLKVPVGTIIKESESGEIIADLTNNGDRVIVAKGGIGGKGNARFTSSTRQAPNFSENGEPGEEKWVILELKLLADVGLIGLPNAGKSTLLSVVTKAKPKIADYPFTTLTPNLGVVGAGSERSFVIADIPGLIHGAHEGAGLGHQFLRHIERTKVLIHVVDGGGLESENPLNDFKVINEELKQYSKELMKKPQIVAVNKIDLPLGLDNANKIEKALTQEGYKVFPISAIVGSGLDELINYTYEVVEEIKQKEKDLQLEEEDIIEVLNQEDEPFSIKKVEGMFIIEGQKIKRIAAMASFDNEDSLRRFQRTIENMGVEEKLRELGIKEGDTVKIGNIEFEYYEDIPYNF